jgi:hypothetical protein
MGRSATVTVMRSEVRLAHCVQCSAGEEPRSSLTLFPGVSIDCSQNPLRQSNVACDKCLHLGRQRISHFTSFVIASGTLPW